MSNLPIESGDFLREKCGVFGAFGHENASRITALGLHALQHRGQEAAGIVSLDDQGFYSEYAEGLVSDYFTKKDVLNRLKGPSAVGHVRYRTTGGVGGRNIQPLFSDLEDGGFAVAHNGNLTNSLTLRHKLMKEGAIFQSTSDTETIPHLVARARGHKLVDRIIQAVRMLEGAYSCVILSSKKLIGVRDPLGIRPLVLGQLDGAYILASETVALDIVGATFVRDIEPGELVVITHQGLESFRPFDTNPSPRPCIFEYVYFARPDSILWGRSVYKVREAFGEVLAQETGVADADFVVPIPDSGVPAALGFSKQSKIPFAYGLIRSHYIGRTFIEPTQSMREAGVLLKHNPNKAVVQGRSIVLIDDSLVRGTTARAIVKILRQAGTRAIHLRIACPQILYPDFYGIHMPSTRELFSPQHTSYESACATLGVDSIGFLSLDGLYHALGSPGGRKEASFRFADHCFTGEYPTPLEDRDNGFLKNPISRLRESQET